MGRYFSWLAVSCLLTRGVFAADSVPGYFYPTSAADVTAMSAVSPAVVTEVYFKAVQMDTGDAISAALPFYPESWSGPTTPFFTAAINSDADYAFSTNTATLVQQALTTNDWTSAFTGGISVDSELSFQGAGVASLGGNMKDFMTSMRQFANTAGKSFSFYLGARYLGGDGDSNNPDYVADILGAGAENFLLMPTYADQADHDSLGRLTNAVSVLAPLSVSYKWILEVDAPTDVFQQTVAMLLDPTNQLVDATKGYSGIVLYPFNPGFNSDADITANLAFLNTKMGDFYPLGVPEPQTVWLLGGVFLAMALVRKRRVRRGVFQRMQG